MITRIDHAVLTVRNIDATCEFYTRALGMGVAAFGEGRKALTFGEQKLNLHQQGHEFEPKAQAPTPGSMDICFVSDRPLRQVVNHLQKIGIAIESGPVSRTGATGQIQSIYIRDPDNNLIEVCNYV